VATLKSWHYDGGSWFQDGGYIPMDTWIEAHPHPTWDQAHLGSLRSHYRQRYWRKISKVADAPLLTFDAHTTAMVTILGTEREIARNEGLEVTYETLQADASNAVHWPGGRLRLRAIATAWRTAVDDPPPIQAVFHDALDGRRWAEDEAPAAFREMTPDYTCYLHVRLLFEAEGDLPFEDLEALVFDARTHASVAARYQVEGFGAGLVSRKEGRFLALDLDAALWHDTPLEVMIDLPAGPEQRHPFPALGQAVSFLGAGQRRIELTRLGMGEGYPDVLGVFVQVQPEVTFSWRRPAPGLASFPVEKVRKPSLWDLGELLESDYLRVRARSEDEEWVNYPLLGNTDHGLNAEGAELIFRPERLRCWFKVAGLPRAPNPRNVRDLLDIRIPGPVDEVNYGLIAETAQLDYDQQSSNPHTTSLETPRMDVTLRELLRLHAKEEKDVVTVDRKSLRMVAQARRRTWRDDFREWWRDHAP